MSSNYYYGIKTKIKNILDLDTADRAFKECFWSWAIHRGVLGSYKAFMEILEDNSISSLDYISKECLFDLIYDKRYEIDPVNRYKKGIITGWSERELLRQLLTPGTFSVKEKEEDAVILPDINPCNGTIKVIYKGSDGLNIRKQPSFDSDIVDIYTYGKISNVTGITNDGKLYKLENGYYISANKNYVQFTEYIKPDYIELYRVRIVADELSIRKGPGIDYGIIGNVRKNQVFTIIEENNNWGLLKSKTGWIYLPKYTKKC